MSRRHPSYLIFKAVPLISYIIIFPKILNIYVTWSIHSRGQYTLNHSRIEPRLFLTERPIAKLLRNIYYEFTTLKCRDVTLNEAEWTEWNMSHMRMMMSHTVREMNIFYNGLEKTSRSHYYFNLNICVLKFLYNCYTLTAWHSMSYIRRIWMFDSIIYELKLQLLMDVYTHINFLGVCLCSAQAHIHLTEEMS